MSSIFSKSKNNEDNKVVLSKKDILQSIPEGYVKSENKIKQKNHTEWRWRIYNIDNNIYTEISKLEPNCKRQFFDNTGNMIDYDLDNSFDKYITEQYFYYAVN